MTHTETTLAERQALALAKTCPTCGGVLRLLSAHGTAVICFSHLPSFFTRVIVSPR